MFEIDVSDRQSLLTVSEHRLQDIAQATLAAEQVAAAEIAIAVLDDAAIHAVNRDHLQHDYPTDVISFVYSAERAENAAPQQGLRGQGLTLDGEVLVSAETAVRMAQRYQWRPEDELTLYLVHGLLHLCGYDDLSEDEQQVMRVREREVLKIWDLTPHYADENSGVR